MIEKNVEKKIFDFIIDKNYEQQTSDLPQKGNYFIEYNFQIALNDKYKDYIFVISNQIHYHNYSMSEKKFGLYTFDCNTGAPIDNFDDEKCYFGFFNDLRILKRII
jgi:hypothetical protein